jgi:hypothetical protein
MPKNLRPESPSGLASGRQRCVVTCAELALALSRRSQPIASPEGFKHCLWSISSDILAVLEVQLCSDPYSIAVQTPEQSALHPVVSW